ncbi:MAG: DUF2062 domain-containing protein, partial [bacterium]|nr:DUF2062 domain-containing protein [bacterium]
LAPAIRTDRFLVILFYLMAKKRKFAPKRWVKLHLLRVLRLKDSPQKIAGGVALGVFIGIFPTFYLGAILALVLATLLRVNRVAAVIGTLIMNPITQPFVYAFSYALGLFFLGEGFQNPFILMKQNGFLQRLGKSVVLPYLLGITIVSIIITVISYWLTLRLVIVYRQRRLHRLHHHKERKDSD